MNNVELAQIALKDFSAFAFDELSALLDEEIVFDLRTAPEGPMTVRGRGPVVDWLRSLRSHFKFLSLSVFEAHACPELNVAVVAATSFGELSNGKGFYDNRHFIIFEIRKQRIAGWREFSNPDALTALQARLSRGYAP